MGLVMKSKSIGKVVAVSAFCLASSLHSAHAENCMTAMCDETQMNEYLGKISEEVDKRERLLADVEFLTLSEQALDMSLASHIRSPQRGAYQVVRIDNRGRLGLKDLDGNKFNMRTVRKYTAKVRWVSEDENGVKQIHQGKIGWINPKGKYGFLIRFDKSSPYPQLNSGLVIEKHR